MPHSNAPPTARFMGNPGGSKPGAGVNSLTMAPPKETKIVTRETLAEVEAPGPGSVLVYDRGLARRIMGFREWKARFRGALALPGGEKAKDLEAFPARMARIVELTRGLSRKEIVLVSLGGGSTGDFTGFAASVLKRGVALEQIPTTWLAAVDSAHGGKNALNVMGAKNQVGTFHFPSRVYLVREILLAQPERLVQEGMVEFLKAAFLDGGEWTERLRRSRLEGPALLWDFLLPAVRAKTRIVARDPREERGPRRVLNLGHTLGHALEAFHGLSHGRAVALGIGFALRWSEREGLLSGRVREEMERLLERKAFPAGPGGLPPLPRAAFRRLVSLDKKAGPSGTVRFVFLRGWGKPVVRPVSLGELEKAAREEGWVR